MSGFITLRRSGYHGGEVTVQASEIVQFYAVVGGTCYTAVHLQGSKHAIEVQDSEESIRKQINALRGPTAGELAVLYDAIVALTGAIQAKGLT